MKIANCPRCCEEHDVDVSELKTPLIDPCPADPKHPCTYHFWAICPKNKEPILFQDRGLDDVMIPCPPDVKDVEKLAYRLWEHEGFRHGKDSEHWIAAEMALTTYFRIPSVTQNTGHIQRTNQKRYC